MTVHPMWAQVIGAFTVATMLLPRHLGLGLERPPQTQVRRARAHADGR
jgi:hypothetical protein